MTEHASNEEKNWTVILHLSQLLTLLVPVLGAIAPFVIWMIKKEQFPVLNQHGKVIMNWILSSFIWAIVFAAFIGVIVLVCASFEHSNYLAYMLFIGLSALPLAWLIFANLIFPIVGAIRANREILWEYPLSFRFLK